MQIGNWTVLEVNVDAMRVGLRHFCICADGSAFLKLMDYWAHFDVIKHPSFSVKTDRKNDAEIYFYIFLMKVSVLKTQKRTTAKIIVSSVPLPLSLSSCVHRMHRVWYCVVQQPAGYETITVCRAYSLLFTSFSVGESFMLRKKFLETFSW